MKTAIVIPARYGSSRFPGKPLALLRGVSALERVWWIAKSTKASATVTIATEDARVARHAASFGAEVVITSDRCRNGSERVFEAVMKLSLKEDIIINLQGDEVLTPPHVLDSIIEEMILDGTAQVVTPAVRLEGAALRDFTEYKLRLPQGGTTVVFDVNRNALYFSRAIIPFTRTPDVSPIYRHIGLYGFRRDSLAKYIEFPPSGLEMTEGLEQLRAIENGMDVRVVVVNCKGRTCGSVDAPDDVATIEDIIAREGELVPGVAQRASRRMVDEP